MSLRAQDSDYLHNFRFLAAATNTAGVNRLTVDGRAQAGFNSVTTPEATVEVAEYKEGQDIYTQKYPGNPTVNDITLSRGVARSDSAFWSWVRQVIEGTGAYRATLTISHLHRVEALTRAFPAEGIENVTRIPEDAEGMVYHLFQAFPTRHKVAADLDATSSDVSLMELDVAFESFEVEYLAA